MNIPATLRVTASIPSRAFKLVRSLPIDQLVQWAIADELPKGEPEGASAWDAITRAGRLGNRPDRSSARSYDPIVPGAPHSDALVIAAAVRQLDTNLQISDEELAIYLGPHAQLVGHLSLRKFSARSYDLRKLLFIRAEARTPPVWDVPAPAPHKVRHPKNDSAVVLAQADGRAVLTKRDHKRDFWPGEYPRCPIEWRGLGTLLSARAEYAAWYYGLTELERTLRTAKLTEHAALPPNAPSRPWTMQAAKPRRILRAKATCKLDRLPLNPTR